MKKYVSVEFVATKYGIYKATQDDITSLPGTIIANGQNAAATIKGNMTQSETPTPTTPIQPQECGDLETTGEHAGQYKIPILSNSITTPIYLGEVETTRKIKKLVLTGQETWTYESDRTRFYMSIPDVLVGQARSIPIMSTHFTGIYDGRSESQIGNNSIYVAANTNLYIKTTEYNSETAFTEYLQQQYANGTPVTVWYVLATETTTTLNEPLRKIGAYSDSVSSSTIPTTAGSQTLDVDTILKPSEVDITYTGWHMYDDKKYTSGEWI